MLPDYTPDGGPDFGESLRADAGTPAARGFASNFVAAWLAFWPYVAARFGAELEEAYARTCSPSASRRRPRR